MSLESRLNKLEKDLNLDNDNQVYIVLDDFISNGHFKNKAEQALFVEWRINLLRQQNRSRLNPMCIYSLSDDDVNHHIETFRKDVQ